MHELSICTSIARLAVDHAGGRRVRSVQVRVGALRQLAPESLDLCWSVVSREPLLNGSTLEIEKVPGVIDCSGCGARREVAEFVLLCPVCGGGVVSVVSGEELLVTSIEVTSDAPALVPAADRTMRG